jgi:hypothetical protein
VTALSPPERALAGELAPFRQLRALDVPVASVVPSGLDYAAAMRSGSGAAGHWYSSTTGRTAA